MMTVTLKGRTVSGSELYKVSTFTLGARGGEKRVGSGEAWSVESGGLWGKSDGPCMYTVPCPSLQGMLIR
jgi:hypothetical protein